MGISKSSSCNPQDNQDHDAGIENNDGTYEVFYEAIRLEAEMAIAKKALDAVVAHTLDSYRDMFNEQGHINERLDHRTGCSSILCAIVRRLVDEYGWTTREAVDALVLEAVRTGCNIEAQERRERIAAKAKAVRS